MLYHQEQRNFRRMLVDAHATVEVNQGQEVFSRTAICHDLSASGMQLFLDTAVEPGATIKVRIQSASASVAPLNALTRVVRCTREDDGQYSVGVQMLEVS